MTFIKPFLARLGALSAIDIAGVGHFCIHLGVPDLSLYPIPIASFLGPSLQLSSAGANSTTMLSGEGS